jgi:predicted ABC-type sugar transport system permease subunit
MTYGNSLHGGRGHLKYTVLGVLIMTFLYNGMNLLAIDTHYQNVFLGVVLVAAGCLRIATTHLKNHQMRSVQMRSRLRSRLVPGGAGPSGQPALHSSG